MQHWLYYGAIFVLQLSPQTDCVLLEQGKNVLLVSASAAPRKLVFDTKQTSVHLWHKWRKNQQSSENKNLSSGIEPKRTAELSDGKADF